MEIPAEELQEFLEWDGQGVEGLHHGAPFQGHAQLWLQEQGWVAADLVLPAPVAPAAPVLDLEAVVEEPFNPAIDAYDWGANNQGPATGHPMATYPPVGEAEALVS